MENVKPMGGGQREGAEETGPNAPALTSSSPSLSETVTTAATPAVETGLNPLQTRGGASVTGSTLVPSDGVDAGGVVVPLPALRNPPLHISDISRGLELPVRAAFTLNDSDAECFVDDEENAADDDDDLDDLFEDELPPGMPAFGLPPAGFNDDLPPGVPGFHVDDEELPPMNPVLVRQNAYWRPPALGRAVS